jgi:hypothetical protein
MSAIEDKRFSVGQLANDRMPAMELVIPWRSGEILEMIQQQVTRSLAGLPTMTKREMDLLVEKLGEAEAREQEVIDSIELRVREEHRKEARLFIPGRDRSTIQREDGTRP